MQNKPLNFLPVAMSATLTTNIFNPPTLTGGTNATETKTFAIVKGYHVCNKTGGAVTFSLWKGATGANAAGTELFNAVSVPANSTQDYWSTGDVFKTADYLVGGASAGTSLSIKLSGEIGVAD